MRTIDGQLRALALWRAYRARDIEGVQALTCDLSDEEFVTLSARLIELDELLEAEAANVPAVLGAVHRRLLAELGVAG